jgi:hypothetical protein
MDLKYKSRHQGGFLFGDYLTLSQWALKIIVIGCFGADWLKGAHRPTVQ